jgi:hypothetical protein
VIGILQITGLWADAMNSLRNYISDFAVVV